jgi:hypothetical protein
MALLTLAATPAHAMPGEDGWFHWLSGPLARIVRLFDLTGSRVDADGGAGPAKAVSPGPRGLFGQAGSYVDPDGKPAPPPAPLVADTHNQ